MPTTDIQFGTPGWVDLILSRIQTVLASASIVAPDLVFLFDGEPTDLLNDPPGDTFLAIGPLTLPVMQGPVVGGGGGHTVYDGRIRVDVMRRVADQQNRAKNLYSTNESSLTFVCGLVCDALQTNTLSDADTFTPLVEPMRVVSLDFNQRKPKVGWAWCRITFSAKFRAEHTLAATTIPGEGWLTGTFDTEGVYPA